MDIYLVISQLKDQPFRLIEREKLRYTDSNESGLGRILHLQIDLLNCDLLCLQLTKHILNTILLPFSPHEPTQ